MTISNFSVTPKVIVPGESVHVSFTLAVTSSDTVNGLTIYGGNASWFTLYRDDSFTLAAGKSKAVSFDTVIPANLTYVSQNIGSNRSLTDPKWAVVLGDFGSRAEVSNPVTYLNMRCLPTIAKFSLERATGGVPDDEGQNVLSTLRLSLASGAATTGMQVKLYYAQGTQPTVSSSVIDLTGKLSTLLTGVTNSSSLITNAFSNGSDWHFLLTFGDSYEQSQVRISLPRSFANLHLSGCSTGGACFGGFSASTEDNPLLESHYPAKFHAGIEGVTNYSANEVKTGGTWIDGKPIYRAIGELAWNVSAANQTLPTPSGVYVTRFEAYARSTGDTLYPLPTIHPSGVNYSIRVGWSPDTGFLFSRGSVWNAPQYSIYKYVVIYEYTKKTD